MKQPLLNPGTQQVPRFPRRVFYIGEDNASGIEELVREITLEAGYYPQVAWDEPYSMQPEPIRQLPRNVFAAIRERFAATPAVRTRQVH